MGNRADQYRRLAEECLALSRLDGFSMQGRLNLLEMARIWNRLAQQQQQVQPEKDGEWVPEHNEAPAMAADPNRLSLEPERSSWSAVPYRDKTGRVDFVAASKCAVQNFQADYRRSVLTNISRVPKSGAARHT
jgi:hypothetical protein